ncbi:MAG: IS110 family transposase [Okeania sp. SIO2H7]|nr:IS110 family transposase [Okeania sp. SIO2H7]
MFAGVDVGSSSIVVCWAIERPTQVRETYRDFANFREFDLKSIDALKSLGITKAFLEPTGWHYARLWISILERSGADVCLVGHGELLSYRKFLDLPDKDDRADALALLCYGFDFEGVTGRFLFRRDADCQKLRDFYFRLGFYARLRTSLINRLRQDLKYQFPEISNVYLGRKTYGNTPLTVRWLSGEEESQGYESSLACSVGEGLYCDDTIFMAELLYDIFEQERWIEDRITDIFRLEKFVPYLEVLQEFKMGNLRTAAFIISQVFPLDCFLGDNGRPIVEKRLTENGNLATRRLSEARFKSRMGAAPSREFSGKSRRFRKRGSREARIVLWRWFRTIIEIRKNRPASEVGQKVVRLWEDGKESGVPVKKLRAKCRSVAMALLFRRLCDKLL